MGFRCGLSDESQNNSEFLFIQTEALEARRGPEELPTCSNRTPLEKPGHVNSTLADRPDGDG